MKMTTGAEILTYINACDEYKFLREDPHLGNNIILLGLGGSHAYGMNKEGSDIDIRGIALNSKDEILLGDDFEQIVDTPTDTTIYSFNKMLKLLVENNPNTIEILGLKPEQYLYITPEGKLLVDNKRAFLSKRAIAKFAGYANQQLRRLENKVDRTVSLPQHLRHIIETINHARYGFGDRYTNYEYHDIDIYLSTDRLDDYKQPEILIDMNIKGMPLSDYNALWNELSSIERAYAKIGKRNQKAIEHEKLGKHMAHLVRLYYMCFDIMEHQEIITYREKEHDMLMAIRNNEYLTKDGIPKPEFYAYVGELEKEFNRLKEVTKLPDHPDYDTIRKIKKEVNESVVSKH